MTLLKIRTAWRLSVAILLVAVGASGASAQSSSLLGDPSRRQPLTLEQSSWMYQPPPEVRQIRLNDLLTVMVDEKAEVLSEGEVDRRRKTDGLWTLKDWIIFMPHSLGIMPDPQTNGSPTISQKADGKYRAEAGVETLESLKLRLTCRVVDIRPNGNLVIEGRRVIQANAESWEVALTGVIRAEDLLPNNTIPSEAVADMRLTKREAGIVHDGYRRGWFLQWRDRYKAM